MEEEGTMRKVLVSFGLLLCVTLAAEAAPGPAKFRARIDSIAADQTSVVATPTPSGTPAEKWTPVTLGVTDAKLKADLKSFASGDLVWITAASGTMQEIELQKVAVPFLRRLATVVLVALVLWLLAWISVRGTGYRISRFIVGRDNRYSKSKFQIAIWFATVIVVYLSALYLRWWGSVPSLIGGVDIPENLLLLSGISALSFATSKGITQGRANRAAAAGVDLKPAAAAPSFPSDLVTDDGNQPDLGDFQMVVITVVAVAVYIVQAFSFLSLLHLSAKVSIPDVDPTLLGIFGISHGAYLTKKAVSGDDGVPAGGQNAANAAAVAAAAANPPAGQPGPV
jgi:hypothetical protein